MFTEFTRVSDFVPASLKADTWDALEPLYKELIGRELHCANCLRELIMDRSELDAAAGEAGTQLMIHMTCHTDDEAANSAYLRHVEHVQPQLKQAAFELDRKIATSPFAKELDKKRFGQYLKFIESNVQIFRPENIPLETELAKLSQEYAQISGAMTVQFRGREHTLPQMGKYNEDPDRATREEAWRAVADRRLVDAEKLDGILEQMLPIRDQIGRNAGFANYRDFVFVEKRRFDYSPATCDEFARSVETHVTPLLRAIMARRAKAMGLGATSLRPWDGQVDPKGRAALKPFTGPDELMERTSRVFARMDPSLSAMFEALRSDTDPGCLDLESRKGKAPGGYQSMRDRIRKPFIFMNAAGLQRDVETMLHEAGHAFHSLLVRDEPILSYRSEIPLEFCEVASMSMELTAHPFTDEYYPNAPQDAARANRVHLEQITLSLATIAIVDQFQHWMHTNVGHTRRQRHEKWAEITRRFGPNFDWTGLEGYLGVSWHRVLHIFEVPFYYIEYGIAQLGALQVWAKYRADPQEAIRGYKNGLKLGSSQPLPALFRAAGIEFDFGPAMVKSLMAELSSELAKLPD